jgi:hypothetical protein
MGDSPELMLLGSSLFNNLIEAIGSNVCATGEMPKGMQYPIGTLNEAYWAMAEVWKTTPPEAQIIKDVDQFLVALECIIEDEGASVERFDARRGYRRATKKAIKGRGTIFLTGIGCLAPMAMEGMWELVQSLVELTQAIYLRV